MGEYVGQDRIPSPGPRDVSASAAEVAGLSLQEAWERYTPQETELEHS